MSDDFELYGETMKVSSRAKSSNREIAGKLLQLQQELKSVKAVRSQRLEKMAEILEEFSKSEDRPQFWKKLGRGDLALGRLRFEEVLSEANEFTFMRGLLDLDSITAAECIKWQEATSKPVFSDLEKRRNGDNHARNIAFELSTAYTLRHRGIEVDIEVNADLTATVEGAPVEVECKRLLSEKQLKTRLEEASDKLRRIPNSAAKFVAVSIDSLFRDWVEDESAKLGASASEAVWPTFKGVIDFLISTKLKHQALFERTLTNDHLSGVILVCHSKAVRGNAYGRLTAPYPIVKPEFGPLYDRLFAQVGGAS